jgi:hypothetical protein
MDMSVRLSVCVVLYRQRPYDGLIPRLRSHTDCVYDKETEKTTKAQQKGCRAIDDDDDDDDDDNR